MRAERRLCGHSQCVTRRTSHVTRHTSHVTRHTSHVTRRTSRLIQVNVNTAARSSLDSNVPTPPGPTMYRLPHPRAAPRRNILRMPPSDVAARPSDAADRNRRRSTLGSTDDGTRRPAEGEDAGDARVLVERSSSRASVASTSSVSSIPPLYSSANERMSGEYVVSPRAPITSSCA
jgi:hypothetical protein